MMPADAWERIRTLFDRARSLPPDRRAVMLDANDAEPAVRQAVHALLRAHDALESGMESGFLDQLDPLRAAPLLSDAAPPPDSSAPPDPDELTPGTEVGHYRIVRRLGRGGMGVVHLAHDPRLDRFVAIKLLPHHLSVNPVARHRFEEEARAASALDHRNIVTVYEIGDAPGGRLFIAMAYCEGATLRQELQAGPMPVERAITIATRVADGLAAAHQRGIVHRDIKPRNIIVTAGDTPKIVDFGIAQVTGSALAQAALTPGTIAYMSPEQTRGEPVDARADVWAAGALLYEMLAGRRVFAAGEEQALVSAIRSDDPEPLARLRPDAPASLCALVERCLAKDPVDRPADGGALLAELVAIGTPAPVAPRRRPLAPLAAVLALVTLVAAAGIGVQALTRTPALEPRRVAVAAFENRTGLAEHDDVANMAGFWIENGLWHVGFIEVVPLAAFSADPSLGDASPRTLARGAGARLLLAGALYRHDDVLRLQVRITDVKDGRLVAAVDPGEASLTAPLDAVEEMRRRVQSVLAARLDTVLTHVRAVDRPPRLEAYRAYLAGRDAHVAGDLPGALRNFRAAAALDSTFVLPRVISGLVLNLLGESAAADSVVRRLELERDALDAFSRAHVDWLRGVLSGDTRASRDGMQAAAALAPGSTLPNYQLAEETLELGQPAEAVRVLDSFIPEQGELRGWFPYWRILADALHLQRSHRRELREAQRAGNLYPDDPRALMIELQALAARGRIDGLESVLEAAIMRPRPGEPNPGALLLLSGLELRAHEPVWRRDRHRRAARGFLERAVAWYRASPDQGPRRRYELARALVALDRHEEARAVLEALRRAETGAAPGRSPFSPGSTPHSPDPIAYTGALGVLAAGTGDTADADAALAWLETVRDPYARGRPTYWRAAILAARGRHDDAVALLRDAFDQGLPHSIALHTAPELDVLREYRPFQVLMRPPD
jgi:tetratricopeptide (TPR) repeat protein